MTCADAVCLCGFVCGKVTAGEVPWPPAWAWFLGSEVPQPAAWAWAKPLAWAWNQADQGGWR